MTFWILESHAKIHDVDDNLIGGPDAEEIQWELAKIFKHVKGHTIPQRGYKVDGKAWTELDFLGMDVHHSREARSMRICVRTYIEKIGKKFDVSLGAPVNTPNVDETASIDEDSTKSSKEVKGYPAREVVGALQWVATCARPDIAVPAAALARHVASVPPVAFAKACRKVLQYLLTTASIGVSYSPEEEEKSNEIYATPLPEGRDLPRLNIFSDAGFANNVKS